MRHLYARVPGSHARVQPPHARTEVVHARTELSYARMAVSSARIEVSHAPMGVLHARVEVSYARIDAPYARGHNAYARMEVSHARVEVPYARILRSTIPFSSAARRVLSARDPRAQLKAVLSSTAESAEERHELRGENESHVVTPRMDGLDRSSCHWAEPLPALPPYQDMYPWDRRQSRIRQAGAKSQA
jgi:hypothetical protein